MTRSDRENGGACFASRLTPAVIYVMQMKGITPNLVGASLLAKNDNAV
jgi:hypothetical protein